MITGLPRAAATTSRVFVAITRRGHDVARVRRDLRSLSERAEVQRLEVGEGGVLALDAHDRLIWIGRLAVVERLDDDLLPRGLPQRRELARDLEDLARRRLVPLPVEPGEREPDVVETVLR